MFDVLPPRQIIVDKTMRGLFEKNAVYNRKQKYWISTPIFVPPKNSIFMASEQHPTHPGHVSRAKLTSMAGSQQRARGFVYMWRTIKSSPVTWQTGELERWRQITQPTNNHGKPFGNFHELLAQLMFVNSFQQLNWYDYSVGSSCNREVIDLL